MSPNQSHPLNVRVFTAAGRVGAVLANQGRLEEPPRSVVAALHTDRPVKIRLNRDQDMHQTGKRHPFISKYKAGFSDSGDLLALEVNIYADGGWSSDLSGAILDRALFHLDNCYHIPNLRFEGRVLKTNHVSHTAFIRYAPFYALGYKLFNTLR